MQGLKITLLLVFLAICVYGIEDRMRLKKNETFTDNALGRYLKKQFEDFNQNLTRRANQFRVIPPVVQRYVNKSIGRVENALLKLANEPSDLFEKDIKQFESKVLKVLQNVHVITIGEHPEVDQYIKMISEARSAVIGALNTIEAIRHARKNPIVQHIFQMFRGIIINSQTRRH